MTLKTSHIKKLNFCNSFLPHFHDSSRTVPATCSSFASHSLHSGLVLRFLFLAETTPTIFALTPTAIPGFSPCIPGDYSCIDVFHLLKTTCKTSAPVYCGLFYDSDHLIPKEMVNKQNDDMT